jgi:SAM-dependent methyltransferase
VRRWYQTLEDRFWLQPDEEGAEEAAFLKRALHLRRGQALLDAPCGAGRIGFHLARAGCLVTGVDLRPQFIARARRRFRRAGLPGTFIVLDLRNLDFEDRFHGVFNWCGSFGYFSETENLDVLTGCARALRNGGRLLIDQPNREYILRHFVAERRDGDLVTHNRWEEKTQRIVSRRIVQGREIAGNRSSMRLYSLGQMCHLFRQVGLVIEDVYGSISGEAFRRSSRRMIAVARKP